LTDGFAYQSGLSFGPGQPCAGQRRSGGVPPSLITCATGHGISTVQPSPTPFGFSLGPTNLPRTNLPEEPLGFRRTGFSPVFSLLIPAFSLPPRPPLLAVWLHSTTERSPTRGRTNLPLPRFGTQLEPPYIIGAGPHSASKLLRTLSMVAATKPTSWLSTCSHFLSHLAGFRDLSGGSGLFPF